MSVDAGQGAHDGRRLALRLVHDRGGAGAGTLIVPPEGRGMGDALGLGRPPPSGAEWRSADRCRIEWRGVDWHMTNDSSTLVCAVNGMRLSLGASVLLHDGDVVELGLLRFQVAHEQGTATGVYSHGSAAQPRLLSPAVDDLRTAAQAAADSEVGEFHLRDLALPSPEAVRSRTVKRATGSNPFAVPNKARADLQSAAEPAADWPVDRQRPTSERESREQAQDLQRLRDILEPPDNGTQPDDPTDR